MRAPGTGGGGIEFCAIEAEASVKVAQRKANLLFMIHVVSLLRIVDTHTVSEMVFVFIVWGHVSV
jgi:hypothetical protein